MVLFSRGDVCFPTVCCGKDLDLFLTCAKRNAPSSCPHSAPHFLSFYFFLRVRTAVSWLATPGRTGSTSAPVETHEEGQEGGSSVGRGLNHGRSPHPRPRWLPQGRARSRRRPFLQQPEGSPPARWCGSIPRCQNAAPSPPRQPAFCFVLPPPRLNATLRVYLSEKLLSVADRSSTSHGFILYFLVSVLSMFF